MNDAPRPPLGQPQKPGFLEKPGFYRAGPLQVGPIHYQILCGAGLLLVLLAQLEQGLFLGNLLVACVGMLGIVSKMRAAPLMLLVAFAAAQIGHHLQLFRTFEDQAPRPLLHVRDLLMAVGLVAYVSANYRLQSLWTHILPPDARQREVRPRQLGRWWRREHVAAQQKRATRLLTPQEIARFVLALPLWALLGQVMWIFIAQPWSLTVFPQRLNRLIALAWFLIVAAVVLGTILAHWRRRQMDRVAAALLLQDTLWHETRREQRRTFRWLAWRKLHERAERREE